MKNIVRLAGVVGLIISGNNVFAQQGGVLNPPQSQRLDALYQNENTPSRKVIAYPYLRQADVIWQKRVWRVLDLREKMNLDFYYPTIPNANRRSLWDVIFSCVKSKDNGRLKVYDFNGNDLDQSFMTEKTKTEADSALYRITSLVDSTGTPHQTLSPFESQDILQYLLKEDWFFDKQRSVMDVRILGLSVLVKKFDDQGNELPGQSSTFWIYFPELRPILANAEVYNVHNDAERRTYEDIFWKRQFSSYIIQESNVANRPIAAYVKDPLDAQLEAEGIKNKMFNLEHDMWQY
ncbi:MAG TPA: gliding motility protein GldN [Bacteroidia bacterium]|nr:gliding motility protein GldN [Bacteroidia bacterium]